jgi:SAM-dependent methyltransferase
MMSTWTQRSAATKGAGYDAKWRAMAAAGQSIHGEADFISGYEPASVLDAGCGTGRVAIELDRRGTDVVGVDLDESMLAQARAKKPKLRWVLDDLASAHLGRTFDVVAMPGNVMIFVEPGTEVAVVANMARHISPGGRLIAGYQLLRGRLGLREYDEACAAAGLVFESRWSTWDRAPFADGDYAISVHVCSDEIRSRGVAD